VHKAGDISMRGHHLKQLRVFLPFACGYFLSYLYRVVNAVLAPDLVRDLGLGPADLGLLTATYFLTFAAFQLPLGILLDRYGPRKIEATLLVFGAAGAFIFSRADGLPGLVVGRALIGFGVSACLMAAFTAFVTWFPAERLPQINGFQMAAGGLGALIATAPVEAALRITDWRGVFFMLAVVTLMVAVAIYLAVPDKGDTVVHESQGDRLRGITQVFTSPVFWRVAPWTTLSQASFFSIQGLWAGPWLRDVGGLDRMAAAGVLSAVAGSMVVGFVLLGTAARLLSRSGHGPLTVAAGGMFAFMLVQGLIVMEWVPSPPLIWILFGILGTSGIVSYADLSQRFPRRLTGRVNTGLNLLVFVAAFATQWGMGAVIARWPADAGGGYPPHAYRTAFGLMLALQAVGLIWFGLMSLYIGRRRVPSAGQTPWSDLQPNHSPMVGRNACNGSQVSVPERFQPTSRVPVSGPDDGDARPPDRENP
jgi:MFS family permease